MEKLKMHSPDLTQENIAKLLELFPNCVTEARADDGSIKKAIDFDLLRQELSDYLVEGPRERYHLNWPGKGEALLAANAPIAKTLRPCREESVDFDVTRNVFIEGDNLEALKLLQETYLNRVKLIYIDPPYNTANQFLYDDDFALDSETYFRRSMQVDSNGNRLVANFESNGRRHSDWLSSLKPRLRLARNLLREDGAIFISIDDNEVHNLIHICDEVFGEHNFLGLIPVITNMKGRNDKEFHAQIHEYLVAYQRMAFSCNGLSLSPEKRAEYDQVTNDGRRFQWRDLRKRGGADTRRERPNLYYPIFIDPETGSVALRGDGRHVIETYPVKSNGEDGRWRWEKETLRKRLAIVAGRPVKGKDKWNVSYRVFIDDPEMGERREKPKSVWIGTEFSTDAGTKAVNSLLPGVNAKELTPKSVGYLRRIIELATDRSDIILDFYAGTGTTAHAMFDINQDDGDSRRFVLVQLAEACEEGSDALKAGFKSIAEIAKERIRRAGKRIRENACLQGLSVDVGFRVLKIDTSNMKDVYYKPDVLQKDDLFAHIDNIKGDRSPEDLLFQVLLDWGVDLSLPISKENIEGKTVFFVDQNALAACFDTGITEEMVKKLATRKPLRVVFRDSGFSSDAVKINVEQIFKLLSPDTEVKVI
ncbi:site-specific DNA-methyltransferase [Pirellulaceae bacterium SH449]